MSVSRLSATRHDGAAHPAESGDAAIVGSLVGIGRWLQQPERSYAFVTVTPETHRRVIARAAYAQARTLRDVFGWALPFDADLLPPPILDTLDDAGLLIREGELFRSAVRYSTLDGMLFAHSAYPTAQRDAVFFGPDTYRFTAFLRDALARQPLAPGSTLADVGCGSGAGGIVAATSVQNLRTWLTDINPLALAFAQANCRLAGIDARLAHGDLLQPLYGGIDAIIANPPYLADLDHRTYRDGGGDLGCGLGVRIVEESLKQLDPGGRLILYTGAPIVDGQDVFLRTIEPTLRDAGAVFDYRELDPDVFGEELQTPGYATVERIAAVGLTARIQ